MRNLTHTFLTGSAAALLAVVPVAAQQNVPGRTLPQDDTTLQEPASQFERNRDATDDGMMADRQQLSDADVARWLTIDNRLEVQLAQFGQNEIQNREVNSFAAELARDHNQFIQKLQPFTTMMNDRGMIDRGDRERLDRTLPGDRRAGRLDGGQDRLDGDRTGERRGSGIVRPQGDNLPDGAFDQDNADGNPLTAAARRAARTAGRAAEGVERTAERVAEGTERAADRVAEGAQNAAQRVAQGTERAAARTRRMLDDDGRPGPVPAGADRFVGSATPAFLTVYEQIGQRALSAATEELQSAPQQQRDVGYMMMQKAAHMNMLAALRTVEQSASPRLKPVIEEGISTTEDHLRQAERIIAGLQPTVR